MKKIFTAIVAMVLAAPAFAQFSSGGFELDKQNLYYGVRLGLTVADLSGDAETDAKVGMTLGGVVGLRVSQSTPLFLESGLYYTERGAKDVGYSNLEIPLLIKYGIKATDDIAILPFVGPYFARACWGKTKQPKLDGTGSEKAEYNKLYVELGYQFGVSNIAKNDDLTIRSNAFFANFGVNF